MKSHRKHTIFAFLLLLIIGSLTIFYVYTTYEENPTSKAISFIASQYNAQVGLLREYPSANKAKLAPKHLVNSGFLICSWNRS